MKTKIAIFLAFIFSGVYTENYFVGVYYYPWYDYDRHWQEGYLRDKLVIPQHPYLGRYSSRNFNVIQNHINWSINNGIDFWVVSWWGPGSWEDVTILNYISPILGQSNLK